MNKYIFFFLIFFAGIFFTNAQKKYATYQVKQGETLQSISSELKISSSDLLQLNPDIKDDVKVNDVIVIPNIYYDKNKDINNFEIDMVKGNDIIVDGYVYHVVLSKETLYGITSNYRVTSSTLKNHNPFLLSGGLKFGQTLKIPLPKNQSVISDTRFKPYVVKPKETKYNIAKQYGISIDSLEQINPEIKKGLQINDVILVPDEKLNLIGYSAFNVYKVQKGETLFGLSKKFDMTQDELIGANPEIYLGVKEGMLIKIPNKIVRNESLFIDELGEKEQINVSMMLPFQSNIDTLNFDNNRLLNISTDFYFGALAAIDSLKKQGLSVNLKVFDTQKSKAVSKKIGKENSFDTTDVIIGPMFLNNLQEIANILALNDVLLVSPISGKDHSFIKKNNLVQDTPTDEQLAFEMLHYIKEQYSNQKVTIITDDKSEIKLNSITRKLKLNDSLKSINILKPKKGYIDPKRFKTSLDSINENWVLLIGSDEVFIADAVHNLGVLRDKIKITLFAFSKGKNFDNIDNNYLARVNFHYPSHTYIDYNSENTKNFISAYKKRFFGIPSKYAIKGFDETYDILMRLSDVSNLTEQGISERISSKFNYIENTSGSIINQGVFILAYDGLNLIKVR
ncbi:MAG: LysM peptidoglycan-binding domain-containing protein [Bacteroidota bacterium]